MEKLLTIKQTQVETTRKRRSSGYRRFNQDFERAGEKQSVFQRGEQIGAERTVRRIFFHGARKIDTAIVMLSRRMVGILTLFGVASIGEVLHAVRRNMIANVRHGAILARMSVRRKRQPTEEQ
ncbi:hypothetical protein [Novosphingopyxis baekryungensis]|jgi:hypothetical protein|uniref:hypothetical protein n=1 Tax=Novosphingopyxis baekryungensis TaxID=279369 RepID=UPI0003B5240D|nr:hypothetical protein [Novosphingopyxis baekryungensis]